MPNRGVRPKRYPGNRPSGRRKGGSGQILVPVVNGPNDWIGEVGDTATFTVSATSGDGSPLTYQWQEFTGGSWQDMSDGGRVSGTTTDTLTITPVEEADSGRQFRCMVCNDTGCTASRSGTMLVLGRNQIVDESGLNTLVDESGLNDVVDERSV